MVCVSIDRVPGTHYPFGGDVSDDQSFSRAGPTEPEHEYKPHPQRVYTSSITVNPPASFRPIPIQDQDPTPKPAPPAVPPKPFKDTSVFQNVDLHAVEVRIQSVICRVCGFSLFWEFCIAVEFWKMWNFAVHGISIMQQDCTVFSCLRFNTVKDYLICSTHIACHYPIIQIAS